MSFGLFHPVVSEWFQETFGSPSEPQIEGWPAIHSGSHVLIAAPTGSGKTLAAFLGAIDRLTRQGLEGELPDTTQVLYVSPLKALANDVQKNLLEPLRGITEKAASRGVVVPEIRPLVRTGDTPATARRKMTEQPPHILVTTPESLFILLTSESGRRMLSGIRTVIVDEIHSLARDKRGSHLMLSLERLEALAGRPIQRIGLSATQKPVDEVADFLTGPQRQAKIIDIGHRREIDVAVEVPKDELGAVASNDLWEEIYDRLAELIQHHRTTLIFVNTRRLAERATYHLADRIGAENVAAHHGSLAREVRMGTEDRLKRGELRAVVATASLELGLDIGTVDLVCQLGSTRSIALALQRIGRSGHWRGAVPKGRIFATTRDELLECAALVRSIRRGELDRIRIPVAPTDILAQQITAAVASEEWREDDLYDLVKKAGPYRSLPRETFDAVVRMLSEGISTSQGRRGAFLHRDKINGRIRARRGARLAAITSGGAIPENAAFLVKADPEETLVGTVDEDFATESMRGDVFLLGNTSWRIRHIGSGVVRVEDAHGAAPDIPFWRGEAPARTDELSAAFSKLREEIAGADEISSGPPGRSDDPAGATIVTPSRRSGATLEPAALLNVPLLHRLHQECGLDRLGAEQAVQYAHAGARGLGAVPSQQCVVAERFFDEGGGMQLVLHAPFGGRINKAWGLALRKRFCRSFNFELQAAATENGILISLSDQHSFPLDAVFSFVTSATAQDLLVQALFGSPLFPTRWRWTSSRALAILRFSGGRKVPPPLQRMRSDDLLASVFPEQAACLENIDGDIQVPDHPLVEETLKDCLYEAMDLDGLIQVLKRIENGEIRCVAIDTREPSPFSHEILNSNPYTFLDNAPLEERRARAVQTRRALPEEAEELGQLDPDAIQQVRLESWPPLRDVDEIHDALLSMALIPETELSDQLAELHALEQEHRVVRVALGERRFWAAAERAELVYRAFPEARFHPEIEPSERDKHAWDRDRERDREEALAEIVRYRLDSTGPTTAPELAELYATSLGSIDSALHRIEAEGQILRGSFRPSSVAPDLRDGDTIDIASPSRRSGATTELEWCNRRLLARIHRLTLGRLRREIEPASPAQFMRFLLKWQHVAPGTRLFEESGVSAVLEQLQGFESAAVAWETTILPLRIAHYKPEYLDSLCLSGRFAWGRLTSPAPSEEEAETEPRSRAQIRPTRIAPVTFFKRDEMHHFLTISARDASETEAAKARLSHPAREVLQQLEQWGACFATELTHLTGRLRVEVEEGLWELVAAGLVTADGFDNLRSLIDPRRRRGQPRFARKKFRAAGTQGLGRWTLLRRAYPSQSNELSARESQVFATQLLARWGIVFRDLLARESLPVPWRDLLQIYRRLEARGEIRGGRFVSGFLGEQFALPQAVDAMRAIRRDQPRGEIVRVSGADPLNLVGIILPGPRIRPHPATFIEFRDGVPVEEAVSA
ncbi:MAG: DEAD/DEAH box helicase [Acidobacteria bacterium]|nr:MAG: DEAD/DEAH box helicase [Acidobacteriota bacterium]